MCSTVVRGGRGARGMKKEVHAHQTCVCVCVCVCVPGRTLYVWPGPAAARVTQARAADYANRVRTKERNANALVCFVNDVYVGPCTLPAARPEDVVARLVICDMLG
jgi:hypothetical protein